MKKCKNCGKELIDKKDFANNDTNSEYCNVCLKSDGSLRSFDDFKNIMISFLLTKEGQDLTKKLGFDTPKNESDAKSLADRVMAIMSRNIPELNNIKK